MASKTLRKKSVSSSQCCIFLFGYKIFSSKCELPLYYLWQISFSILSSGCNDILLVTPLALQNLASLSWSLYIFTTRQTGCVCRNMSSVSLCLSSAGEQEVKLGFKGRATAPFAQLQAWKRTAGPGYVSASELLNLKLRPNNKR